MTFIIRDMDIHRIAELDWCDFSDDDIRRAFEFMADWMCPQEKGNKVLIPRIFHEAEQAGLDFDLLMLAMHEFEQKNQITRELARPPTRGTVWRTERHFTQEFVTRVGEDVIRLKNETLDARKLANRKASNVVRFSKS